MSIWNEYKKIGIIKNKVDGIIYKVKNKKTGNYLAIEEINKKQINMNEINNNNLIKKIIESEENIYIIMELCVCNLDYLIKIRDKGLSIKEIKEILTEINKNKKIKNINLKPSKILISSSNINKYIIKDFNNSFKGDNLLNIGILIYYMYFKEYINQDEISNNTLKSINNTILNDLMTKLLNKTISWDEYFNHSFFQQNIKENNISLSYLGNNNLFQFNFQCIKHSNKEVKYYCQECKTNICDNCLKEHDISHKIITFFSIGLNKDEINIIDNLFNKIEEQINSLNKYKNDIKSFYDKMKSINKNRSIYKNDDSINYKNYYIDYLKYLYKQFQLEEFKKIEFKDNIAICEYRINEINKDTRILNSYEEGNKDESSYLNGNKNEKEIRNNCEISINKKKIKFTYNYKFDKKGKYKIKLLLNKPLINANFMFFKCSSLISLDLSNFNTDMAINMNHMFYECSSLTSLNLSNWNTNNVIY